MRVWKKAVVLMALASLITAACGGSNKAASTKKDTGTKASRSGPIVIGVYDQLEANGPGALAATLGDPRVMDPAVADYINAHGGMGGRKIKLVTAGLDGTLSIPVSQQNQAACTKFSSDSHAAFVINPSVPTPDFVECLRNKNIIDVMSAVTTPDESVFNNGEGLVYGPSFLSQSRLGRLQANALGKAGFLTPSAKVGVVSTDHPWYQAGATEFKKAAKQYGVTTTSDVTICLGCAAQQATSEAQNAVVKLKAAGVDHVVLIDLGSAGAYLAAAKAANFTPPLGITSNIIPATEAQVYGAAMFKDAVGPGFVPATDVDAAQDTVPQTEAMKTCASIMAAAGAAAPTRVAVLHQRVTCDGFLFVKAVLDRTKGDTSPKAFLAAVEKLGDSFVSANTWKTTFGPNRLDGAAAYRLMRFAPDCSCTKYDTEEFPITE